MKEKSKVKKEDKPNEIILQILQKLDDLNKKIDFLVDIKNKKETFQTIPSLNQAIDVESGEIASQGETLLTKNPNIPETKLVGNQSEHSVLPTYIIP